MRNPTELMRSILTNEMAQKIIDYVSPVYGNSYVGLWMFQAMGTVLGEVYDLANGLKYETNPITSTLLLDQWESHYGLERDPSLTTEQRRNRIATRIRSRGACNPEKLAEAVSTALGGVEVDITENAAQNTFYVNVWEPVESFVPAAAVVERMKPAHLICIIRLMTKEMPTADMKTAVAVTYAEKHTLQVVEQETTADVYISVETLYIMRAGVYVDGENLIFGEGTASVDGETLIL